MIHPFETSAFPSVWWSLKVWLLFAIFLAHSLLAKMITKIRTSVSWALTGSRYVSTGLITLSSLTPASHWASRTPLPLIGPPASRVTTSLLPGSPFPWPLWEGTARAWSSDFFSVYPPPMWSCQSFGFEYFPAAEGCQVPVSSPEPPLMADSRVQLSS